MHMIQFFEIYDTVHNGKELFKEGKREVLGVSDETPLGRFLISPAPRCCFLRGRACCGLNWTGSELPVLASVSHCSLGVRGARLGDF